MNPATLNIGYVTTVSGRWPREIPTQRHAQYSDWLQKTFANVKVIKPESFIVTTDDVDQAIDLFRCEGVDLIVIVLGAFTGDIACVRLAEKLNVPTIVWALPEPPFDGGRLMSNALVAATMNMAALKRLGHVSYFVYGAAEDERVQEELDRYFRLYYAKKRLNNTFLGMIGYRPTGFYSSTFDETLIRKTFGVAIEEFDLSMIFEMAKQIDAQRVAKDMQAVAQSIPIEDLPDDHLENHSRLYFALHDLIETHKFNAIALKCWPEMGNMRYTPCAVLSRFADERFIIGCESDVDCTITMLMEELLGGGIPFMCDLIEVKEAENTALFWHCGQAARALHAENSPQALMNHSLAGQGTVIEGTLKQGVVTIARVSHIGDEYKLFIAKGEAVETEKVVRGVMVKVKSETDVLDLIYTIAEEGVPHHYTLVWADIYDDLIDLCRLMNIEAIEVW